MKREMKRLTREIEERAREKGKYILDKIDTHRNRTGENEEKKNYVQK